MQVAVIGAGHVGLVTAACLAHVGHDVVVDDDDLSKLDSAAGRLLVLRAGPPGAAGVRSPPAGSGSPATRPRRSATGP